LDVSLEHTTNEKADALTAADLTSARQSKQLENPEARYIPDESSAESGLPLLNSYAYSYQGVKTGDDPMFILSFWELPLPKRDIWEFIQLAPSEQAEFSGLSGIVRWENGEGLIHSVPYARATQGLKAVGMDGVAVHGVNRIFTVRYSRKRFQGNIAVIIPKDPSDFPAIWCFCASKLYGEAVRTIDQKVYVTNATLAKVPFDLERWKTYAKERYPSGLPKPYSDDPAQWIFHGHPCGSVIWDEGARATADGPLREDASGLQVAVCRLLGYRWPAELDPDMELSPDMSLSY
jgi:hypothetical protein